MVFDSPWDRSLRISTFLAAAVALGACALALWWAGPIRESGLPAWPALLPALAVPAVLALSWALAPRRFSLTAGQLLVERPLLSIRIPLGEIRAVAALPDGALRGCTRVWGTSGFCGYYGRFWGRALGSFRLYATRTKGLVLVGTTRGRFVLSPEPPGRFVEAVLARAPRAVAELPVGGAGASARRAWLPPALAAVAVALLAFGVGWSVFGRAPLSVHVDDDAVRIERRWLGPVVIPLDSIRDATPLTAEQRRGWVRTRGTAAGRFAFGEFKGPALGSFRLYAWRRGGAVLLETDGGRVVVTPEDPAAFAEEVRSRLRR